MIIKDTFLRDMAKLVAWYPLRWIVTVSPWGLAYGAGKLVGTLDSIISKGRTCRIVENLLSVYGDKMTPTEALAIARRIIQRHYVEHMEFYKFATLRKESLPDHITFDGLENLELELKKGKGVILAHMHFGSKQFPLVALGLMDHPVSQIGYRDSEAPDYSFIHKHVHLRIRTRIEDSFKMKHILLGDSLRSSLRGVAEQRNPDDCSGRSWRHPRGRQQLSADSFPGQDDDVSSRSGQDCEKDRIRDSSALLCSAGNRQV